MCETNFDRTLDVLRLIKKKKTSICQDFRARVLIKNNLRYNYTYNFTRTRRKETRYSLSYGEKQQG